MPQLYDLTVLLDPNAPDDRRDAAIQEVESLISSGGELVGSHDWGTRRMAYEIDHRPEAEYRLYQFNAEPELLDRLRQRLKIADGVLRHRIIRLKPGSPPPPAPRDYAPRPREEKPAEGRVAARAAADAPPPDAPPADAPPSDASAPDAPPSDAASSDA